MCNTKSAYLSKCDQSILYYQLQNIVLNQTIELSIQEIYISPPPKHRSHENKLSENSVVFDYFFRQDFIILY